MAILLRLTALTLFITGLLGGTFDLIPFKDDEHFELNVYGFLLLIYAKLLDIGENV